SPSMFPNPPWWRKIRPVLQLTDCDYFGKAAPGWRRLCFFWGCDFFLARAWILADARSFARNSAAGGRHRSAGPGVEVEENACAGLFIRSSAASLSRSSDLL